MANLVGNLVLCIQWWKSNDVQGFTFRKHNFCGT